LNEVGVGKKNDCGLRSNSNGSDSSDILTRGTYYSIAMLGDLFRRLLLRNRQKLQLQFNLQQFTLTVHVVRRQSVNLTNGSCCPLKADVQTPQIMSPRNLSRSSSTSCIPGMTDKHSMWPVPKNNGTNGQLLLDTPGNIFTTLSISVEIKIVLDSQGHTATTNNNNYNNPKCITQ
jgi:hypothetical protein